MTNTNIAEKIEMKTYTIAQWQKIAVCQFEFSASADFLRIGDE